MRRTLATLPLRALRIAALSRFRQMEPAKVCSSSEYDQLGCTYWESAPYWWSDSTAYWTTYSYDALNRVAQFSRPTSATDSTPAVTLTTYEGLPIVSLTLKAK